MRLRVRGRIDEFGQLFRFHKTLLLRVEQPNAIGRIPVLESSLQRQIAMTVKVKVGAGHVPNGTIARHRFKSAHGQTLHLLLAAVHQQLHNLAVA